MQFKKTQWSGKSLSGEVFPLSKNAKRISKTEMYKSKGKNVLKLFVKCMNVT